MEVLSLNLIPTGTTPVVHVKQYDVGRTWRFELKEGPIVYTLDGSETIECDIKKKDGNVVTVAVTNTSASYIDIETTLQMTACSGDNLGAIRLKKGSDDIGTLNFILSCERSPLENGIESDSSIHNLNTMVDEMVAEEVAEQYDSANVIFDTEPTSGHGTPYTVTSEGIKTAIDNAFDYDNTASGSLVHITDGADNIPVKSLVSQITAVESGSGEKSPTNPYTFSGFDSGIITRCGANLIKKQALMQPVHLASGTTIYTKLFNFSGQFNLYGLKKGLPDIPANWTPLIMMANTLRSVTLTDDYDYIGISSGAYSDLGSGDIQVSLAPFSEFSAYNGNNYTFAFGQTVYGGYFDNKGNLVVTKIAHIFDGTETLISLESGTVFAYDFGANMLVNSQVAQGESLSTHFVEVDSGYGWNSVTSGKFLVAGNRYFSCNPNMSLADYQTFLANQYQANTPVKAICLLAIPITLAITSQDIPTLLECNIFSNCGDVTVDYYTNKANDILEFVDSEIGKKNGTNIPIEENSQDSIKDYIDDEVSSTKDYVDNGLNDKVAYKSGEVVYSNYVTGAYVSGSGNYVEFCIPINTKATSGTITNLGTTLNVFIGSTRLTNEVTLSDSSIVAIKDGYAQVELKLNSTQTANSVATVSLDGFTVNFE